MRVITGVVDMALFCVACFGRWRHHRAVRRSVQGCREDFRRARYVACGVLSSRVFFRADAHLGKGEWAMWLFCRLRLWTVCKFFVAK